MYNRLKKCVDCIRKKTDFIPEIALILGSGLGDFAEEIDVKEYVNYNEIEELKKYL